MNTIIINCALISECLRGLIKHESSKLGANKELILFIAIVAGDVSNQFVTDCQQVHLSEVDGQKGNCLEFHLIEVSYFAFDIRIPFHAPLKFTEVT